MEMKQLEQMAKELGITKPKFHCEDAARGVFIVIDTEKQEALFLWQGQVLGRPWETEHRARKLVRVTSAGLVVREDPSSGDGGMSLVFYLEPDRFQVEMDYFDYTDYDWGSQSDSDDGFSKFWG